MAYQRSTSRTLQARALPGLVNSEPAGNVNVSLTSAAVSTVLSSGGLRGHEPELWDWGVGAAWACAVTGGLSEPRAFRGRTLWGVPGAPHGSGPEL